MTTEPSGLTWETLVDHALMMGASDLHVHVSADNTAAVRARIDGVLVPWAELPAAITGPTVTRLKAAADLVKVTVRRDSSKKFDNLLKGKVWLDGFSVTAEP